MPERFTVGARVVWAGEQVALTVPYPELGKTHPLPPGSSGKLREEKKDARGCLWLFVDWGEGLGGWYPEDVIASTDEAAALGLPPWGGPD